jgi:choline dehydrogenase
LQTETARHDETGLLVEGATLVKARSPAGERDLWNLHVLPWTNPERDELGQPTGSYEISAAVFAVKPRSRGRLRLRAANPLVPPSIEHGFLSDPTDLAGDHLAVAGLVHAVGEHVDHVQPTRRTAGRTQAEARFARATEPQPLKDRALELLAEGNAS